MTTLPTPTDYRSIRLNPDRRSQLRRHAVRSLYTPPEEAAETEAFNALYGAIRTEIDALIPADDLAVLRRYNYLGAAGYFRFTDAPRARGRGASERRSVPPTQDVLFCFCPRDPRAFAADELTGCGRDRENIPVDRLIETCYGWLTSNGYSINVIVLDRIKSHAVALRATLLPFLEAWRAAVETTNQARDAVLLPLYGVIARANTLQTVAKVWPEAMRLADDFEGVRTGETGAEDRIATAVFAPPA